ncbi:MAG: hypothetical protein P0S94_00730, partial [Simkaniaceae bacterium]|nr:hypothetical protein [Simkaniaceae bacterium]
MSVSPSSMYNIRHAIFFVEDRATLGHLSHLLNMRDTTDHALSQAAATYIHSIKPLLTKKINLLSGAEQTTNLQDSILSLKAQAIRCEILFIQTCNQNGI